MCDASQILFVRFFISTIGLFSYIYRICKITKVTVACEAQTVCASQAKVTADPHISTHNLKGFNTL